MPSVAVSQERRKADDLLQLPCVWAPETGRIKFQSVFNLSKKASLVNLPTHTRNVVVEHRVVRRKEKTPDDMRVSSDEESTEL